MFLALDIDSVKSVCNDFISSLSLYTHKPEHTQIYIELGVPDFNIRGTGYTDVAGL